MIYLYLYYLVPMYCTILMNTHSCTVNTISILPHNWHLILIKTPHSRLLHTNVVFLWFKCSDQPMIILRFCSNSNLVSPFVNRYALCSLVPILLISISLKRTFDLNQWYFIPMCFVLEYMRGPLLLTRCCVPISFSHAFETSPTPFKSNLLYLLFPALDSVLLQVSSSPRKV